MRRLELPSLPFAALAAFAALSAVGARASAQEHSHFMLAGGHALGDYQQSEFGFGGLLAFTTEHRFGRIIGVEGTLDAYDLTQGSAPSDPRFARHGQGFGSTRCLACAWRRLGA